MYNKDETNLRKNYQIIHINPTVQFRDKQPTHSKDKLTFCINATLKLQ